MQRQRQSWREATSSCALRASSCSLTAAPCCSRECCCDRTRTTWQRCGGCGVRGGPRCTDPLFPLQWHKRLKLLTEGGHTPAKLVTSYTEAVRTVDPWKAVGKPSSLWTAFARFYEAHGDVANARAVFERASQADFRAVDDLAAVWCEWAELEIRAGKYAEALSLMQRATAEPSGKRLHRSGKRSRSYF